MWSHFLRKTLTENVIFCAVTTHLKGCQKFESQTNTWDPVAQDIENVKLWDFVSPYERKAFMDSFSKVYYLMKAI